MPLYRYGGKILKRALFGGLAKSQSCCCGNCCSKLPTTIYAHVTFFCGGANGPTSVHALTEAAYTGTCITNPTNEPRIWEKLGASVNSGKGVLGMRFACTTSSGGGVYYACHDGCVTLSCPGCPPNNWTMIASNRNCTETTLGTLVVTPAPSGCGSCAFPPAPMMTIVFKTTP